MRRARKRRRSGRRLFAYDRALGARFVAGADEAGRGCLAGPLVAAAVLFDYERIGLADLRALTALNDSKQHTEEGREELYPRVLRIATKVAVTSRCVRGIDERGLHVTNLAALSDTLRRVAVAFLAVFGTMLGPVVRPVCVHVAPLFILAITVHGDLWLLLEAAREILLSECARMFQIPFDQCVGRTISECYRSQRWVTGGVLREGRGAKHE